MGLTDETPVIPTIGNMPTTPASTHDSGISSTRRFDPILNELSASTPVMTPTTSTVISAPTTAVVNPIPTSPTLCPLGIYAQPSPYYTLWPSSAYSTPGMPAAFTNVPVNHAPGNAITKTPNNTVTTTSISPHTPIVTPTSSTSIPFPYTPSERNFSRVQLPDFITTDPKLWFQIADDVLQNADLQTRCSTLLSKLSATVLSKAHDLIRAANPTEEKFAQLRQCIIDIYSVSEDEQFDRLFGKLSVSGQKPSHLLAEMGSVPGVHIPEAILRRM